MVIAKCEKCGKKYEIGLNDKLSDFQCECGGELTSSGNTSNPLIIPNPSKKKPVLICSNMKCKYIEDIEGKYCPECGSETIEKDNNLIFAKLNCPNEPIKDKEHKPKGLVCFNPDLLKSNVKTNVKTNIKPCKTCGKEVSTNASKCPHCGEQNPTAKPFNKMGKTEKVFYAGFMGSAYLILAIIGIIIFVVILMLC